MCTCMCMWYFNEVVCDLATFSSIHLELSYRYCDVDNNIVIRLDVVCILLSECEGVSQLVEGVGCGVMAWRGGVEWSTGH